MKNIILAVALAVSVAGCKKSDNDKTHTVTVTMTYLDAQSGSYKPDVNAGVYLFKQRGKTFSKAASNRLGTLTFEGDTQPTAADYSAKANAQGVAVITGVPAGNYNIVVGSNGRMVWSYRNIDVNGNITLTKQFSGINEGSNNDQAW